MNRVFQCLQVVDSHHRRMMRKSTPMFGVCFHSCNHKCEDSNVQESFSSNQTYIFKAGVFMLMLQCVGVQPLHRDGARASLIGSRPRPCEVSQDAFSKMLVGPRNPQVPSTLVFLESQSCHHFPFGSCHLWPWWPPLQALPPALCASRLSTTPPWPNWPRRVSHGLLRHPLASFACAIVACPPFFFFCFDLGLLLVAPIQPQNAQRKTV